MGNRVCVTPADNRAPSLKVAPPNLQRIGDIGQGLDSPHAVAIGALSWATMRGLVISQLIMSVPVDTSRELAVLADAVCAYL